MDEKFKIVIESEDDIKIFISLCISCRASFKKILKHHKNENLNACDKFCEKYLDLYNDYMKEKEREEMSN